jgi:Mannosyl-glycoprotein endo-beta-N-acetylglucosaminidase
MASGSYAKKIEKHASTRLSSGIPARATRQLPDEAIEEVQLSGESAVALRFDALLGPFERLRAFDLKRFVLSFVAVLLVILLMISIVLSQRPGSPQLVSYSGGQVYNMQVGGDRAATWQQSQPQPSAVAIPTSTGPYSVLGKPTISADFINRVLASYNSPAAGKGQALYDMGVKYGIDPAFALAFFMHESSFGTQGEAQVSLSLGNLRCIPNYKCQDGYAWFSSWEDGFQAWYELIRNLYVSQWGLTTVSQIIPKYAPSSDNNDEAAYIAALKHAIDTWHAGVLIP